MELLRCDCCCCCCAVADCGWVRFVDIVVAVGVVVAVFVVFAN